VSSAEDLFTIALGLLQAELPISVRLMGVRASNFKVPEAHGRSAITAFLSKADAGAPSGPSAPPAPEAGIGGEECRCPVCQEDVTALSEAARTHHVNGCLDGGSGSGRSPQGGRGLGERKRRAMSPRGRGRGASSGRKRAAPPPAGLQKIEAFFKAR
jgi:hypothetical protein